MYTVFHKLKCYDTSLVSIPKEPKSNSVILILRRPADWKLGSHSRNCDIHADSAQLELEPGLSLAKSNFIFISSNGYNK